MTDWNWFFSAVAQAVAALVAIFTAFVVSKIIDGQAQHRRNLARVRELVAEQRRIALKVSNRRFGWYNAATLREALLRMDGRLRDDESPSAVRYRESLSFSPFMDNDAIMERLEKAIADYPRTHNAAAALTKEERELLRGTPSGSLKDIDDEREQIDRARAEVVHHIMTTLDFAVALKDADERSGVITGSIAGALVLFFLGVVWPLSFLPMPEGSPPTPEFAAFLGVLFSFKGLLLSIISVGVTAVLMVLLRINLGLKYDKNMIKGLIADANYGAYSPYLEAPLGREDDPFLR